MFVKLLVLGRIDNKLNGFSSSFLRDSFKLLIYKESQFNKKFNDYVTKPIISTTIPTNNKAENIDKQQNSKDNKSLLTINGKTYLDIKSLWLSYKKSISEITLSYNNEASIIIVNANSQELVANKTYDVEIKILPNKQNISSTLKGSLEVKKPSKNNCSIECFEAVLSGSNDKGDKINVSIDTELSPSEEQ